MEELPACPAEFGFDGFIAELGHDYTTFEEVGGDLNVWHRIRLMVDSG